MQMVWPCEAFGAADERLTASVSKLSRGKRAGLILLESKYLKSKAKGKVHSTARNRGLLKLD